MQGHNDSFAYPPRGLSRTEAARYLGIGTTLFDELVVEGKLPKPKMVKTRTVWDRNALDLAFEELPEQGRSAKAQADLAAENARRLAGIRERMKKT